MIENNSLEMKTVVETYIIEETAELIYDNEKLDEWNKMISELGLNGQTKIVHKDKSPIPYLPINRTLQNVFETLCPCKISVEKYDISPIPVEILQLISLSKKDNHFQKIEIWYDDKEKDPLCIGFTGDIYIPNWMNSPLAGKKFNTLEEARNEGLGENDTWYLNNEKLYLLGRWADVKRSFKELAKMARERYVEKLSNEYRRILKDTQRKLDDIEIEATERFSESSVNNFPF